jgi:hypothetical protein
VHSGRIVVIPYSSMQWWIREDSANFGITEMNNAKKGY